LIPYALVFDKLHNETISRNNLDEISQNFVKESTKKFRKSYFATTLSGERHYFKIPHGIVVKGKADKSKEMFT
jgi:hypothetical protein